MRRHRLVSRIVPIQIRFVKQIGTGKVQCQKIRNHYVTGESLPENRRASTYPPTFRLVVCLCHQRKEDWRWNT